MNQTLETRSNLPGQLEAAACLVDLGFSPDEMLDLSRQGFVAGEFRGARGPYYKVRFRSGGKQRVRYLGTDLKLATQIERALARLQWAHRQQRELAHLIRRARRHLRDGKAALADVVESAGYQFHGFALRRSCATTENLPHSNCGQVARSRSTHITEDMSMTTIASDNDTGPSAPAATPGESTTNLRRRRIDEFLREVLEDASAEVATVGASNAGLMEITLKLEHKAKLLLEASSGSPEEFRRILPLLDLLARYARQQERYTRLMHDLRKSKG